MNRVMLLFLVPCKSQTLEILKKNLKSEVRSDKKVRHFEVFFRRTESSRYPMPMQFVQLRTKNSNGVDSENPIYWYTHLYKRAILVLEGGARSSCHYEIALQEVEELMNESDLVEDSLVLWKNETNMQQLGPSRFSDLLKKFFWAFILLLAIWRMPTQS
ncbi:hypothetical protein SADUNF_Sadunf18G0019800 [Salix dunnii]|uniref:Uncharacterized protein n=1 Tax=Salix dunnii TaxID=1413687 RepID=A0A835J2X6_9ROSI|nr:hypothetical protein SADUNF_Sadunf18G0019800 [Salix dunnii]